MEQQRTIWTVIITVVVAVLVVVSVMAYQSNRNNVTPVIEPVPDIEAQDYASKEAITVDYRQLPSINTGVYALWELKENDEFILLRQFRLDSKGFVTDLNGRPLNSTIVLAGNDFTKAKSYLVTVETGDSEPTKPSATIILNGNVAKGNTWSLTFPIDLTKVTGSYLLATPTNGPSTNETSGIWFLKIAGNSQEQASLNLPVAPAGWVYEGWITDHNINLTTGRFTSPAEKDSFSNYSGPRAYPPFPGEDFLTNAPVDQSVTFPLNLAADQTKVTIGLEPGTIANDQTGATRFGLNLLTGTIPSGATDHTDYPLKIETERPSATLKVLTK